MTAFRRPLPPPPPPANSSSVIINGGCQVAQRDAPNISGSYQYGKVDRFAAKADGSATAGTIDQAETTLLGTTGFASLLSGVTVGSSGAVSWRYRIESRDVRQFINQSAAGSVRVYHDVGSPIDYSCSVAKASAEDNFSTVTTIAETGKMSIGDQTDTFLDLFVADMGDCSNGIELVITAECGAVTTKNFYLTKLVFAAGREAPPFQLRPVGAEFDLCRRYFERLNYGESAHQPIVYGIAGTTSKANSVLPLFPKRNGPSMTSTAANTFETDNGGGTGTSIVFYVSAEHYFSFGVSVAGTPYTVQQGIEVRRNTSGATCYFDADAEL